jgi:hypothetical protein
MYIERRKEGAIQKVKKYDQMMLEVQKRLSCYTIYKIFCHFAKELDQKNVPSRMYIKHAVLAFLYWILYYPVILQMEKLFLIPHSTCNRLWKFFSNKLESFNAKYIKRLDYKKRKAISKKILPAEFNKCTWIVDGTHTPVYLFKKRKEFMKTYYSYKLKTSAFNTQVGILADGSVGFVSDAIPCGESNDINDLRHSGFLQVIYKRDIIMGDGGYKGIPDAVTPHRQPRRKRGKPRRNLSEDKRDYNRRLSQARGIVERNFGDLKNHFNILSRPYRHDKEWFSAFNRFCYAIHNLEKLAKSKKYREDLIYDPDLIVWDGEEESGSESDRNEVLIDTEVEIAIDN